MKQHIHTQFVTPSQYLAIHHSWKQKRVSCKNGNKKQKPDTYPKLKTCMLWALEFMLKAKYNPMYSAYMKLYSWLHRSQNSQSEAHEAEHRLHNNRCHTNVRKEVMQCCVVWCVQTTICSINS